MNLHGRSVAVAVPTLLLAACGDATSSRSGADDATTSPTATASPSETPTPSETATASPTARPSQGGPAVLTLDGLSPGAPPEVPYLFADPPTGEWSLMRPGGPAQQLEEGQ